MSLQAQYNLLAREIEWELLPQCVEEPLALLAWSPLGGGWLTGKYERATRPTGATRLGEDPGRGVEHPLIVADEGDVLVLSAQELDRRKVQRVECRHRHGERLEHASGDGS